MVSQHSPEQQDQQAGAGVDSGTLARAVTLLGRRLGLHVTFDTLQLAGAGELDVQRSARALGSSEQWLTRVRQLSLDELLRAVRSGRSLLLPVAGGWLVGGVRRLTLIGPSGERNLPVTGRALSELTSRKEFEVILVEPRLPLESLSRRATGSVNPWVRLLALLRLEAKAVRAIVLYAVVLGALSLAVPIAVQVLVNSIALGSLLQPLVVLSGLLLGTLVLSGSVQILEWYVAEVLQRRVFVQVAEDFARRLPLLSPETHAHYDARELTNRFFEAASIQKSLSRLLLEGIGLVLTTLVGMLLLAFYHPILLLFDALLVFALGGVLLLGIGAVSSATDESNAKYQLAGWLENVAARREVFGRPQAGVYAAVKADALTRRYLHSRRRHFARVMRQMIGGVAVQVFAMVALLGLGGWLVMERELTLGQLVAAELVVGSVAFGFAKIGKQLETLYDLLASLDKLGKVVDQPLVRGSDITAQPQDVLLLEGVRVAAGPASAELDAVISPGARLLLGDGTRARELALLRVLAGLEVPVAGWIGLGEPGAGPKTLAPSELRRHAVLVGSGQTVEGSVLDNLRLGEPSLDEQTAWSVLRACELHEVVSQLPEGLNTKLLFDGQPLNPSEEARLCLARAIASQPRVMVLDGVLDRLGLQGERLGSVLDAALGPQAPWIALVVSHHPEVRSRCDGEISMGEAV